MTCGEGWSVGGNPETSGASWRPEACFVTVHNSSAVPVHFGLAPGVTIPENTGLWAAGRGLPHHQVRRDQPHRLGIRRMKWGCTSTRPRSSPWGEGAVASDSSGAAGERPPAPAPGIPRIAPPVGGAWARRTFPRDGPGTPGSAPWRRGGRPSRRRPPSPPPPAPAPGPSSRTMATPPGS